MLLRAYLGVGLAGHQRFRECVFCSGFAVVIRYRREIENYGAHRSCGGMASTKSRPELSWTPKSDVYMYKFHVSAREIRLDNSVGMGNTAW
jgi:hypothetical protein